MDDEQAYLTMEDVARRYRKPLKTIRHWRVINYGPRGAKVGKDVLYPADEIRRFDEQIKAEIEAQIAPAAEAV